MEKTSYDPGTPSWVDLSTPDLEGTKRFYGGMFGWEFEDAGEEAGHYHQALLRGRRVAGVGPAQPGGPPAAFWTTYLSGTDVDVHAEAIRSAGGRVPFEPMEVLSAGRMVVGQDPAGAMFGIWEPREHTGAQLVNEHATMTWNELLTRDLAGATAFYGSLFDFAFDDLPDQPDVGYKLLRLGESIVGGIWTIGDELPPDAPAHWTVYFQHDEVDAGLERVRELGGQVTRDPVDSPYGRWAVVQDPQGGVFRLIQSASPAS
jgi:uncharacterized protein